ncbi:hypothetical protein PO124_21550 [Bacillus licheniformis]|nr:hypothetical protein [Bacillus licheniformis]
MIVFMGDHYGISEAHNDALAQFWAKTKSPLRYRSAAAGAADYPHSGVTDQDPKRYPKQAAKLMSNRHCSICSELIQRHDSIRQ